MLKKILKQACYLLEFILVFIVYTIFRLLPFSMASAFGGGVARFLGPLMPVSNSARRHLRRIFPHMDSVEVERIVQGMWENLGRTMGEYPHLKQLDVWGPHSPVEVVGGDIIETLRDDGKPALLLLGHLGNWEYATLGAVQKGLKIAQLYRTLNNPYVDWLIGKVHGEIAGERVTKGMSGARHSLDVLRRGDHLSMLIDQKLNEGMAIPFLGIPAMTPTAPAKFALKFQCPIVPIRVERLEGVHCRVTYYPPLKMPNHGTLDEQVYEIMLQVNDLLSLWIREAPQDWLWLHHRWPKEAV